MRRAAALGALGTLVLIVRVGTAADDALVGRAEAAARRAEAAAERSEDAARRVEAAAERLERMIERFERERTGERRRREAR